MAIVVAAVVGPVVVVFVAGDVEAAPDSGVMEVVALRESSTGLVP